MKEAIRSKARRLFVAAVLGLVLAVVTPFVLNSIAPNLQEMVFQLFPVGFEGGILVLFGEIAVGWPVCTAMLYIMFCRFGFFVSDRDNKSLSLFQ